MLYKDIEAAHRLVTVRQSLCLNKDTESSNLYQAVATVMGNVVKTHYCQQCQQN